MRERHGHAVRAALLAKVGGDPRKEEDKDVLLSPRAGEHDRPQPCARCVPLLRVPKIATALPVSRCSVVRSGQLGSRVVATRL